MFHFLQNKKNHNKGTINVLKGGGGQQSMVKDHIFTFFLDPSLIQKYKKKILELLETSLNKLLEIYMQKKNI